MTEKKRKLKPKARGRDEAEETLRAIREGRVDAFVVEDLEGSRVYTLEGADLPYSVLVERMQQGAAMLNAQGAIIYSNLGLTRLLGVSIEQIIGVSLKDFLPPEEQPSLQKLLRESQAGSSEGEMRLRRPDGTLMSAHFSFRLLSRDKSATGVLITDLTEQRRQVELAAAHEALRISQERLHSIFSSSAVGIAVHTLDGRFLETNQAFSSITGYSGEELARLDCESIMHPDDWLRSRELLKQLAAGDIPAFIVEKRYIQKDGRAVWVQNSVSVSHDAVTGNPNFVVICEDISRRKQAEEALRESESRFRTLADNIRPLTWMADPDGGIFWYNRRWFEFTGKTLAETRGWGWKAVLHPDHVQRVVEKIARCFATGEDWEDTFPLRGKDGNYSWFLSRAVPIRDEAGKVLRWFGTNTDITELREAQEAIRQQEELLRTAEKLAAAGQLAASMAHEVNNPLEAVTNALYLLGHSASLAPSARSYVDIAANELARVSRIVRQSLSYYQKAAAPQDIDLSRIVEESLQVFGDRFERVGIAWHKKLPTNVRLFGFADEIRQVIDNLLLNALDAMPGGGRLRISMYNSFDWRARDRKGVRLTIADTGCGIPRERRAKIFEPFFTTKSEKGTGLGLWVVQGIVLKHEGSIRIRSSDAQDRHGTVVSVFFPLHPGAFDKEVAHAGSAA